ncbi:MAG: hypothetical protein FJ297_07390 [Planctomycetes bacterium]|nr:hypothetical protein [Planctomycetota bacterium]
MRAAILGLTLVITGWSGADRPVGADEPSETWAVDPCPCGPSFLPLRVRCRVRQGFHGADFRDACRAHDRCYEIPCVNRAACDLGFLRDLLDACDASCRPAACRRVSRRMYAMVRLGGGIAIRAWRRSQG